MAAATISVKTMFLRDEDNLVSPPAFISKSSFEVPGTEEQPAAQEKFR